MGNGCCRIRQAVAVIASEAMTRYGAQLGIDAATLCNVTGRPRWIIEDKIAFSAALGLREATGMACSRVLVAHQAGWARPNVL